MKPLVGSRLYFRYYMVQPHLSVLPSTPPAVTPATLSTPSHTCLYLVQCSSHPFVPKYYYLPATSTLSLRSPFPFNIYTYAFPSFFDSNVPSKSSLLPPLYLFVRLLPLTNTSTRTLSSRIHLGGSPLYLKVHYSPTIILLIF